MMLAKQLREERFAFGPAHQLDVQRSIVSIWNLFWSMFTGAERLK
jgi:hypothetical protein